MSAAALLSVAPADVVAFWREAGPERWFAKDAAFDTAFRERFLAAHEAAARGELDAWAATPDGVLALLLLLDQFPRNAFRGTVRMYATDPKARAVAHAAIAAGLDARVEPALRRFVYLPLQHSEALEDHDLAVRLAGRLDGDALRWATHHRGVIERFGRFPHRNALLGRTTTPDERQFLEDGGFGG